MVRSRVEVPYCGILEVEVPYSWFPGLRFPGSLQWEPGVEVHYCGIPGEEVPWFPMVGSRG